MIKRTTYEPQSQAEIDYIEAFGTPNSQVIALEAEIAKLKTDISTLTSFSNSKDTEIAALKIKVTSLELQLAECKAGTVTPPPPPPVEPPPVPPSTDLYFSDDFEGSTNTNLLGGWTDWKTKLPFVGSIYFNTQGGPPGVITEIRKDNNRNALFFQITDNVSTSGTSRAQMTVDMIQDLPFIHTSHRMKIHPDIQHLTNYSNSVRWFTLFELWNARDTTQGGDPAGSSRISLSLFKDTGIGQPLYWHVAYEEMQPSESVKWQVKSTAKIPFDKWFTFDINIVRGIGTAGKVKLVVTEDGGQPVTVFDISNNTIYRNRTDLRIKQWQIFKLYASDPIMDWMRAAGKQISTMYNDVKWFKT